jgi:hypothetical protein
MSRWRVSGYVPSRANLKEVTEQDLSEFIQCIRARQGKVIKYSGTQETRSRPREFNPSSYIARLTLLPTRPILRQPQRAYARRLHPPYTQMCLFETGCSEEVQLLINASSNANAQLWIEAT